MAVQPDTKRALRWIVGVFRKRNVSFQITGGLAASLYGSPRPWNDIDILIRPTSLRRILPDVNRHLAFGPAQYRDQRFDAFMATLKIYGTEIDLVMECRIRNRRTGGWYQTPGLTPPSTWKHLWGIRLPLEPKRELMRIKQILGRKKDFEDVAAMRMG